MGLDSVNKISERINNDKILKWDELLKKLNRVTDGIGRSIDIGIIEVVASCILNELPTQGSCEGHIEKRFGKMIKLRPYIDIGLNEPDKRFIEEDKIKDIFCKKYNTTKEDIDSYDNEQAASEYWDYISENEIKETDEYLDFNEKTKKLFIFLKEILEDFYSTTDIRFELSSIGGVCIKLRTKGQNEKGFSEDKIELYKKELEEEQRQIREFGVFLKNRFLNY